MTNKKQNILFVMCAYAFFWVLLIAVVVLFSSKEGLFSKILPYVQILGTWTPTFALLVLFKKLYPGSTVKEFYKNAFKEQLNLKILLVFALLYLLVIIGAAGISAYTRDVSLLSLFDFSLQSLVSGFVITLFSGATGEESGWRGYLQPSMEKRYSVIKASLIVGIIWAFWHALTWMATGFVGGDLAIYILMDILDKMSLAMIIGICYNRCRNLIIPMGIHFISNFFINPLQGSIDLAFMVWYVLFDVILAIVYIVWHKMYIKKEVRNINNG